VFLCSDRHRAIRLTLFCVILLDDLAFSGPTAQGCGGVLAGGFGTRFLVGEDKQRGNGGVGGGFVWWGTCTNGDWLVFFFVCFLEMRSAC